MRRLVRACLDGGFGVGDRALLETCLSAVEARMARSTSGDEHRRWRNLLAAAHLVRVATAGR